MQGQLPIFQSDTVNQPVESQSVSPTGEALATLGKVGGEFASTLSKTEVKADKYKTGANIITNAQRFDNQFTQNAPSTQNINNFNKVYDQYQAQTLASTMNANKPYAERMLAYHRNLTLGKLTGQLIQSNRNTTAFEFQNTYTTMSNQSANLARQGARMGDSDDVVDMFQTDSKNNSLNPHMQGALSLHGQTNQLISDGVRAGWLSPLQASTYQNNINQVFTQQQILGHYENLKDHEIHVPTDPSNQDNIKAFKESVQNDAKYNDLFSPNDRLAILASMHKIDLQYAQNDSVNNANVRERLQSIHDQVQATGKVDPNLLNDVLAVKPELSNDINNELEIDKNMHAIVEQNSGTYQSAKAAAVSLKNEGLLGDEASSPYAHYILASKTAAANRLKNISDNMINDPVRVVLNSPDSADALHSIEHNDTIQNKNQAMTNYFVNHQKSMQIPDNHIQSQPMSLNISDATTIQNSPIDVGVQLLSQKLNADPNNATYYKNGLIKAGLNPSYFDLVNIAQVDMNKPFLRNVEAALTHDSTAPKDQKLTNLVVIKGNQLGDTDPNSRLKTALYKNSSINSYLSAINAGSHSDSSTTDSIKNSMFKYAQWQYANSNMNIDDTVNHVSKVFVDNLFSHVGKTYVVPRDQNPDSVRETMNYMDKYLKSAPIMPEGEGNANLPPNYLANITRADALSGGYWVNDNQGNYIKVDSSGHPILLTNGNKFGFSSQQSHDPNFLKQFSSPHNILNKLSKEFKNPFSSDKNPTLNI